MAWSTRELAELAGTTVRAVRYYHEVDLLELPERATNGYKQYNTGHLVQLLRIRRLIDIGVPVARVAMMMSDDREGLRESLDSVDGELLLAVEKLERMRRDIAALREQDPTAASLPIGFAAISAQLTEAERSMASVYSGVFTESTMEDFVDVFSTPRSAADDAFDALPADAPVSDRTALAKELAPGLRRLYERYPWLPDARDKASANARVMQETVNQAVGELFNAAQREVLYRAHLLATDTHDERIADT